MKSRFTDWMLLIIVMGLLVFSVNAQTPNPPHLEIVKTMNTTGEICPGGYIDVSITLTGAGSTAFLRKPINAVVVIDKSGSMGSSGTIDYNEFEEPPYAPSGSTSWPQNRVNPYTATVWASWKFYQYFVDNPPSLGYDDYGGLVFYSYHYRIPGNYAQTTPTPIQRVRDNPSDPSHKTFWWHDRLADEYPPGGMTAIGPAMQFSRGVFEVMPLHIPWYGAGTPTPQTPRPTVVAKNFMILLSDGRPNHYWTPGPAEVPSWSNNAYNHAIEMARRLSLSQPYDVYTDVEDITIFTIGLGSQVDTNLMALLADPWNYAYWDPTPTPEHSNHGFFSWALTENDLIDTFETIAGNIVSNLAGTDIYVYEMVPAMDASCPGGDTVWTEIDETSFSHPPTIIPPATPGGSPAYTWNFNELLIGDEIEVTFRMNIPTAAPTGIFSLIECPESEVSYIDWEGVGQSTPIYDPGFTMGDCEGPTVTPTSTMTATTTPTCIQELLFYDDFESGDFSLWDDFDPIWGLQIWNDSALAHQGDYFSYFAGCEETSEFGPNEAYLLKILNLDNPIRPGAVLEFYLRLKGFSFPQKVANAGKDDPQDHDMFIVEVSDLNGHFWFERYDFFDVQDDYFHVRVSMRDFAGSDVVRIKLSSSIPITVHDPPPSGGEPMVFVDDIAIYDYCYDPTPTPTPTPTSGPPIPATSKHGAGLLLLLISILIVLPLMRKIS
ncbi:VWA domain-containing protein [bacterium]|nr:VWA domain-containing protein [bacterium]